MKSFCDTKAFPIFSTKNIGVFEILTFEISTRLKQKVSFEQPGPGLREIIHYKDGLNKNIFQL